MNKTKTILFITPELVYTGAPRSLLRMCKVASELGYDVTVWSAEPGPFEAEYNSAGFSVEIVPFSKKITSRIKTFDLAVCNTILTDEYASLCSRYIPTVWYIREATNIPFFTDSFPKRMYALQNSRNLYCVSEYAAKAIKEFTRQNVKVLHNCVEDESYRFTANPAGENDKISFIQLGSIEYRKGYDVLINAFLNLSENYKNQSILLFAGRCLAQESEYGQNAIQTANKNSNISYLGELVGTDALEAINKSDVVIVASRDESCSLVALEGAMLSKPLIVTDNVGANYIVSDENGFIVKSGDVDDLKNAMEKMIDRKSALKEMGENSRRQYESMASMDIYRREMEILFAECEKKGTISFQFDRMRNLFMTSYKIMKMRHWINDKRNAVSRLIGRG